MFCEIHTIHAIPAIQQFGGPQMLIRFPVAHLNGAAETADAYGCSGTAEVESRGNHNHPTVGYLLGQRKERVFNDTEGYRAFALTARREKGTVILSVGR